MPLLRTSKQRSTESALLVNIFGILKYIDVFDLRQNQTDIHKETILKIDLPKSSTLCNKFGYIVKGINYFCM